jgi:hypothetical protein
VLGQAYGEVKFADRIFAAFGRKGYNTPYMNEYDTRMTPKTFEGVSAYGTAGERDGKPEWRFGGGYISKIKERNSDEFVSMSSDAGAKVDRGVYLAGVNFERERFSIGAIDYQSDDIINIAYTEAKYALPLADGYKLKVAAQFSNQRSTGDKLLTGRAFSTHQWGLKTDLGVGAALLTLAYTDVAKGTDMRFPWSSYPGYTVVQVQQFSHARESAVMLKGAYDFSRHGAEGLSAYALWARGDGRDAPAYNADEVNLNLQWKPKAGALRDTSFLLRYAHSTQRGGGDPATNELRFVVNYDF